MKFSKQNLIEAIFEDDESVLKVIQNTHDFSSRWEEHRIVILQEQTTGRYFKTWYSVGLTEQQNTQPFEFEADMIECIHVVPSEKIIIEYVEPKQ
jgi:hypothetical protein